MDKTYAVVEDTGLHLSDTYTFRACFDKPNLRELYTESGSGTMALIEPVSFEKGLLAGIPNSFELIVSSLELGGIRVFFPDLLRKGRFNVHVSGMKISLLTDGVLCHSGEMIHGRIPMAPSPVTGYVNFYSCTEAPDEKKWCDSINELKLDITVAQLTKLKLTLTESTSPHLAANSEINTCTRCKNISKYYLSTRFSDVTIQCESDTFPAHLFVLCENSEVFKKMFEVDLKEAKERCVEIKDTDSSAILEMLRYFYTGKVENLENNGFKLYELADRYMVENLKAVCRQSLANHVTMENVLETYCFGRKHEIQLLTERAKQFLVNNRKEIIKDYADLKDFMATAPAEFEADIFKMLWGTDLTTTA